jgi:hypothetical protein
MREVRKMNEIYQSVPRIYGCFVIVAVVLFPLAVRGQDNSNDPLAKQITKNSVLVMDIDGDGIELQSLAGSKAFWDIDLDRFSENVAWVTSGDGFLAIDMSKDGIMDDASEFFGNRTGFENGFLALADYDDNGDGVINSQDAVWKDLIVWINAGDAITSGDELFSMDDLKITEIDLGYSDVSYSIEGNDIKQKSSFTIGGNNHDIASAYLQTDDINTKFKHFIHDPATFDLPTVRGYGNIANLHIAMSIDNNYWGEGNLISLVNKFSGLSPAQVFTDDSDAMDAVKKIMFRWAGVEKVDPDSRGANIDARELKYLEAYAGRRFVQPGADSQSDPDYSAGIKLQEKFYNLQQDVFAKLVAQTAGAGLFTGDVRYAIGSNSLEGVTGLNRDTIDMLETMGQTAAYPEVFWANVVRVIEYTVGASNLSPDDAAYLDAAIRDTDAELTLSGTIDSLAFSVEGEITDR